MFPIRVLTRRNVPLVVAMLASGLLPACAGGPTSSARATASPSHSPPATPSADPIAALPLEIALGQTLGVSFSGTEITPGLRHLIVDDHVGAVALFAPNFGDAAGLRRLAGQLEQLGRQAALPAPLLITLDEEGGATSQVPDAALPSAAVMARGGAGVVRRDYGAAAGRLRSLGVGLDLAPVADLRTNPGDRVIGDRAFGATAEATAPLLDAAIGGLHDGGVAATVKHFPGLGGAPGDPHVAIPTDPESLPQWAQTQALSFAAAIRAGADAVMTTAVSVPGLDPSGAPAFLSRQVVIGLLRQRLQFGGVIVTDSLSMGGVQARVALPEAAVEALAAGNDLVLLGNGGTAYEASAIDAMRAALRSGRLDASQIRASARRVIELRQRWQPALTPTG